MSKWFKDLKGEYQIIVVEAGKSLLGTFDSSLSDYVERTLRTNKHVTIKTNESVKEIKDITVVLGSGEEVPFGVCVWSTGNSPLDFVKDMADVVQLKNNRILIDQKLNVIGQEDLFAIGDCAADENKPLPMLAQVANQQGIYLAKRLNAGNPSDYPPFQYKVCTPQFKSTSPSVPPIYPTVSWGHGLSGCLQCHS